MRPRVDIKKIELSLGKDVSNPVPVKSVEAEYTYLQVHPCACGDEWLVKKQRLVSKGSGACRIDELTVQCNSCGSESSFFFRVERTAEEAEAELQAGEAKLQALKDSRHELKKTEIVKDTSVVRTKRWWQFWR